MDAIEADDLVDKIRHTFLAKHPLVARLIAEWDRGDMAAYKQTLAELDEIGRKFEAGFVKVKPDIVFGQDYRASLDGQPQGAPVIWWGSYVS